MINGQGRSLFLKKEPQEDEKEVSEGHQSHVMLPTHPRTSFVLVKANFTFAFFKERFDRPASRSSGQTRSGACREMRC